MVRVAEEYQGNKLLIEELKFKNTDLTNKINKQINNNKQFKKWEKE